jgi:hypothetical protein
MLDNTITAWLLLDIEKAKIWRRDMFGIERERDSVFTTIKQGYRDKLTICED